MVFATLFLYCIILYNFLQILHKIYSNIKTFKIYILMEKKTTKTIQKVNINTMLR